MKYFVREEERKALNSTCFHEFFRGKWDEDALVFWKDDSLDLHDDVLHELRLDVLLGGIIPDYDPYGKTEINEKQWEEIYFWAEVIGGALFEAVCELAPWAEENYRQYPVFTILGI